jgi:ethanolamine ammonia-lyase small subunit
MDESRSHPPPDHSRLPAVTDDPWVPLRSLTPARIALGRAGHALPTREVLAADEAHARARAAVQAALDVQRLSAELAAVTGGGSPIRVASAAPDRQRYLLRPDLGRRLSAASRQELTALEKQAGSPDLVIVIADGLSTTAVARHAVPVVAAILAGKPADWQIGPLVIASQARVALGDEIGEVLQARLIALLIGERPGLSCQESLGIYRTWQPRPGRVDAERNCLSNIHPRGLAADDAAARLWWLAREAACLGTTGIALKDRSAACPRLMRP